jgi:aryl-alcohol dehydrogenase-like predicted oxidoreductase
MSRADRLDGGLPAVLQGTSAFGRTAEAFPVYDAFWELGGRGFDTAWVYGQSFEPGCCERVLGEWMRSRGVDAGAFVLAKGAHTPDCRPERVGPQLDESLDRMGRSSVAVYMLHRDDPAVPVGEFVDALAELVHQGRAEGVGVSNWSLPRVQDAIADAERRGLPRPVWISNQFSLARMVRPVFAGTHHANDPDWRRWLAGGPARLVPWASQGRGVFALRDAGELRSGPLGECWYCAENVERLERARMLAERLGVSPTSIALAWVRAQPMHVHPIVGPRTVAEVRDSMAGLRCELTAAERDWLETGEGGPDG